MIYKNVELHNIVEVFDIEGSSAVGMRRVPEDVRVKLNEHCCFQMLKPASGEVRFVAEGGEAEVTLSSEDETVGKAVIFYGLFQSGEVIRISKEPTTLKLCMPERLAKLHKSNWESMPFAPHVCRVMLRGGPFHFHGVKGEGIRPPRPDELPSLRYLAYGTSITHGSAAIAPHLCYAQQTARRLGADLINLGSGGSAHCEHELADHIAQRKDWHIASLALSVNMRGFSLEEFTERVTYMVHTVAGADSSRAVACITLFPFFDDFEELQTNPIIGTAESMRQALRDAVASCPTPNAHLIEGPDLLTDIGGHTPDIIHPADNGMIQMGENLAKRLKPLLG